MVKGVVFRVQCVGCRVHGGADSAKGLINEKRPGFRIQDSVFRVQGSWFMVQG